jgi:hypothetical protein
MDIICLPKWLFIYSKSSADIPFMIKPWGVDGFGAIELAAVCRVKCACEGHPLKGTGQEKIILYIKNS